MKKKNVISSIALVVLVGCTQQVDQKTRAELASLRLELHTYFCSLENPAREVWVGGFDKCYEHWFAIRSQHSIPKNNMVRIENGFNVHRLFLESEESFGNKMQSDAGDLFKANGQVKSTILDVTSAEISDRYWEILKVRLEKMGKKNSIPYIDEIRNNGRDFFSIDMDGLVFLANTLELDHSINILIK